MVRGIDRASRIIAIALMANFGLAQAQPPERDERAGESDAKLRAFYAGNGLLNRGMNEAAAAEYRSFLADHTDHGKSAVARYGLLVCLFRLEQWDEALAEARVLRGVDDFAYAAEVLLIEGQCRMAGGEFAEAAGAFESVTGRYPDGPLADDAAAAACEALYRAGQHDRAAAQCQLVASRWPDSPVLERSEFFRALSEMARKDFDAAAQCLATYETKFPGSPFAGQVSLLLAQCYQRGDNPDKAIQRFSAVIQSRDEKQLPDALLGLGTLYVQTGKYVEAATTLETLLDRFPNSLAAKSGRLQRAHTWFAQGDPEKAMAAFEEVRKESPPFAAEAAYWIAKCALRKGDPKDAAGRLATAIEQYPDSPLLPEMEYDQAVALIRAEQQEEAAALLDGFIIRHAEHRLVPDALALAANCAQTLGQYDRSQSLCTQFLKRFPGDSRAATVVFLAAENEFLAGRLEEGVKRHRAFLEQYPNDARADPSRLRIGTALYRLEKYDDAAPYFEQVAGKAKSDASFRPALLALGDMDFQRGEWKSAEQRLSEYLALDGQGPSADDAWMKLAYAKQRQERSQEALEDYGLLLARFSKSPHRVQALLERGQILASTGKLNEAEASFRQALEEAGGSGPFAGAILNQLAALAMKRGAPEEAARFYEQAAQTSGGDDGAAAWLRQGQALMAAGKLAEAESAFHKSDSPEGTARLAITVARQERPQEALGHIETLEASRAWTTIAVELRAAVRYEKAWALRALQRPAEAQQAYRALVEDAAGGVLRLRAMLELADLLAGDKQFDAAAATLRELRDHLAKTDRPEQEIGEQCLFRLGVCEFEEAHFSEAAGLFEEFVAGFSESKLMGSALYYAGEANFKAGRTERASKFFAQVVEGDYGEDQAAPAALRLGECHALLQKWALSEETCQKFLERFPQNPQWYQAQFALGWSREHQKRYGDAIAAYEKVTQGHQGPTAARAQFQIGQCLFAEKKLEHAVRELLKVDILYAYPEWSAAALYEAGRCFARLNDPVRARQQFSTVSEKFPGSKWAEMAAKELVELSSSATLPGR